MWDLINNTRNVADNLLNETPAVYLIIMDILFLMKIFAWELKITNHIWHANRGRNWGNFSGSPQGSQLLNYWSPTWNSESSNMFVIYKVYWEPHRLLGQPNMEPSNPIGSLELRAPANFDPALHANIFLSLEGGTENCKNTKLRHAN